MGQYKNQITALQFKENEPTCLSKKEYYGITIAPSGRDQYAC
jgi:hypothetical protein